MSGTRRGSLIRKVVKEMPFLWKLAVSPSQPGTTTREDKGHNSNARRNSRQQKDMDKEKRRIVTTTPEEKGGSGEREELRRKRARAQVLVTVHNDSIVPWLPSGTATQ